MARIFRLGDCFGITATELVLYMPERFEDLLQCRFTNQIREGLYSLCKELDFLIKTLDSDSTQPDYDKLIDIFKSLNYLGATSDTSDGKVKMEIAKFYKAYKEIDENALRAKYGDDTEDIIEIINENLKIDTAQTFPGI